jgi:hypothetical protein
LLPISLWRWVPRSSDGLTTPSIGTKTDTLRPSRVVEAYSLIFEQGTLHIGTALVTAKAPVRTYGTVTRHDQREGVGRQSIPDGARAVPLPQVPRNKTVRTDAPAWNPVLCLQHPLLELTAQAQVGDLESEGYLLSLKHPGNSERNIIDLRAGRRPDMREKRAHLVFRRQPRL